MWLQDEFKLSNGILSAKTSEYNQKRYGKPWIAQCSYREKLEFEFGKWLGYAGGDGRLELPCSPGDVIALGQKDFRNPGNSVPEYGVVMKNGKIREISKLEAIDLCRAPREEMIAIPLAEYQRLVANQKIAS